MQEDADNHSGGSDFKMVKRESEISLVDLWIVLIKRKYIIVATFFIVLLTGFVYTVVTKPVYESKAVIQVGQVGQIVPPEVTQFAQASRQVIFIEVPSVLIKRLSAQFHPDSILNASLKDVSNDKKRAQNVITITSKSGSPGNAKKYLEGILENLLSEHKAIFESFNSDTKERLSSLVKQINQIDKQIDLNDLYLNSIKSSNPVQSSIVAIERGRLLSEKGNIEERIYMMKMALSKLNTKNTQVLQRPGEQKNPVKPNKKIVVLLSIIMGLILAIMAALFSEFISNSKHKINSTK